MESRTFTLQDQLSFARLSGDWNPLHTDPLAARRLLFGRAVVHGVHLLLWALDRWSRQRGSPAVLEALRAEFRAPVGLDEEVAWNRLGEDARGAGLEVTGRSGRAALIHLTCVEREVPPAPTSRTGGWQEKESACRSLTFEEALSEAGEVDVALDPEAADRLFPDLVRVLPESQIAPILATTRIIGMHCPGLHSVFSALDLRFSQAGTGRFTLQYRVAEHDRRFSSLHLALSGSGVSGMLKAFFRPHPRQQAGFEELRRLVAPGEFAGLRALIVGGSRGIGEVAAKLLAAGGAAVTITYRVGSFDAERVAGEIEAGGGAATTRALDVLHPIVDAGESDGGKGPPDILCYFAAPFISTGQRGGFAPRLFREFCDYFVDGFVATLRAARGREPRRLRVLYPSSVFVEEAPLGMGEYAAAKAAGEAICRVLERSLPDLTVCVQRFPRMATDQTASLLPQHVEDPAPIVLQTLRRLRDSA